MNKVLIVEDDQAIGDLIELNLSAAGYRCTLIRNGLEAVDLLENKSFDLVLLDVMLPGADGYEVMEYIRPLGIPVIFITAKHKVSDRVKGLRMGADDYLVKPFDIVELLARVETVLRRYSKGNKQVKLGDVQVDFEAHTVKKNGKYVNLTAKEFSLLTIFITNKNIALFRDVLYEKVWEGDYDGDSRTVDLHVQRLRKKLGWENCLVTVYKIGYRLEVEE